MVDGCIDVANWVGGCCDTSICDGCKGCIDIEMH